MIVRKAKPKDFPQIELMVEEFMNSSLSAFGITIDKQVLDNLMIELADTSFVLEDKPDEIIGILAGRINTETTSGNKIFQEVIWYVTESKRKYGLLLMKKLESYCKENGIKAILLNYIANSMPKKLARLYERMGYKYLESHYIKRI